MLSLRRRGLRAKPGRARAGERGQALLEFILIIPLLLTFFWYLVHVGVAINKSIVGQKHARAQLFLKLYNHRSGPVVQEFGSTDRSHFYIGVSEELTKASAKPVAPVEILGIGPKPKMMKDVNDDPGEPEGNTLRQKVRVRTVFGICTHRKKNRDGVGLTDFCGAEPTGGGGGGP